MTGSAGTIRQGVLLGGTGLAGLVRARDRRPARVGVVLVSPA